MISDDNVRKRSGRIGYVLNRGYHANVNVPGRYTPEDPKRAEQRQIDKNNRQNLIENIARCIMELKSPNINSVFSLLQERGQLPSAFDEDMLLRRIIEQQSKIREAVEELERNASPKGAKEQDDEER